MYLNNILVYLEKLKEHIAYVQKVLQRLKEARLKLKAKKCKFEVKEVDFLRFILSTKGIYIDLKKVRAILE